MFEEGFRQSANAKTQVCERSHRTCLLFYLIERCKMEILLRTAQTRKSNVMTYHLPRRLRHEWTVM